MIDKWTRELFTEKIIAQHDNEDYWESGYVVVRDGDWCAMSNYSHCSCFGTWGIIVEASGGDMYNYEWAGEIKWDWQGSYSQLLEMAERTLDPNMPDRQAEPEDSDYDHLLEVYRQILEGKNNNGDL